MRPHMHAPQRWPPLRHCPHGPGRGCRRGWSTPTAPAAPPKLPYPPPLSCQSQPVSRHQQCVLSGIPHPRGCVGRTALFEPTLQEAAQLHRRVCAPTRLKLGGRHGAELHAERKLALAGPVGERSRLVRSQRRRGEREGGSSDGRQEQTHQLAASHCKHPRVSEQHLCGAVTQNLCQRRSKSRACVRAERRRVHLQPQLPALQRTPAVHTRFFLQRLRAKMTAVGVSGERQ